MNNNKKKEGGKKADIRRMEEARKKKMMIGMSVLAVAIICLGMIFSIMDFSDRQSAYSDPSQTTENEIIIPVSEITTSAKYYKNTIDGVTVKYFVIEGSDGQIHTAFDACDVCYHEKRGYSQDELNMVCNNCGNQYPTNGIGSENSAGGACWPGYLRTSIEDGNLIIERSELVNGKYYFE